MKQNEFGDRIRLPDCECEACVPQGDPFNGEQMRMILCDVCGNKRCPHATDHRNACTNSNEPGQRGSKYPAVMVPAKPTVTAPVCDDYKMSAFGQSNVFQCATCGHSWADHRSATQHLNEQAPQNVMVLSDTELIAQMKRCAQGWLSGRDVRPQHEELAKYLNDGAARIAELTKQLNNVNSVTVADLRACYNHAGHLADRLNDILGQVATVTQQKENSETRAGAALDMLERIEAIAGNPASHSCWDNSTDTLWRIVVLAENVTKEKQ
jgi:hypothetical protein